MAFIGNTALGQQVTSQTKTRPADTDAYAAGDVISESTSTGTDLDFDGVVTGSGQGGFITRAVLTTATARTETLTLHLYNKAPTSALNDNAANTGPVTADRDNFVGAIEFPALRDLGTGLSWAEVVPGQGGLPLQFRCLRDDTKLYGILINEGAPTPASAQVYVIQLTTMSER